MIRRLLLAPNDALLWRARRDALLPGRRRGGAESVDAMLGLLVAAALLGAGQPRLVYEPDADFYGADEITVEVTTDADADNASTVIPIVVAPLNDAATLIVSGSANAEAGGPQICVLANATINDVDGGDSIVSLVIGADRGSITLKPTAADVQL